MARKFTDDEQEGAAQPPSEEGAGGGGYEAYWDKIPPDKAAQMLYALTIKQMLAHSRRFAESPGTVELFAPGELSRVIQAAVTLTEFAEKDKQHVDPYQIDLLDTEEYTAQVMCALYAWNDLYEVTHKQRVKASIFEMVEAVIRGLLNGEGLPEEIVEPAPRPTEKELEKTRAQYAEQQNG